MVIKSKKRKKLSARIKEKVVIKETLPKGFFARLKNVLNTPPERTRVKTVIVEKPIIIQEKPQRISVSRDSEQFDSNESRYSKKSIATGLGLVKKKKEEDYGEKGDYEEEQFEEKDAPVYDSPEGEEPAEGEEEFVDDSAPESDEEPESEEGYNESVDDSVPVSQPRRVRSNAMFVNVWWKKAFLWAFLSWIIILAIELGMQALKLVTVDLSRQWWVVLIVLVLLFLVYFKFFEKKPVV